MATRARANYRKDLCVTTELSGRTDPLTCPNTVAATARETPLDGSMHFRNKRITSQVECFYVQHLAKNDNLK